MLDIPQLREGQTVRVSQKVTEAKRERTIVFPGKLLKVRGTGINKTITVRQNLEGVDVDKIFPVMLPTITKIEVVEQVKSLTKGGVATKRKARKSSKSSKSSKSTKKTRKTKK